MFNLKRIKETKTYLVMDTETTGLKYDDEMIQLCILNESGEVLFDSLFKPARPIPLEASNVHGITNEQVIDAPLFKDVYLKIKEIMEGKTCMIYNADFDVRIFNQTCDKYQLPRIAITPCCVMKAYTAHKKFFSWCKLSVACSNEQIKLNNAHSALGDTTATLALVKAMQ